MSFAALVISLVTAALLVLIAFLSSYSVLVLSLLAAFFSSLTVSALLLTAEVAFVVFDLTSVERRDFKTVLAVDVSISSLSFILFRISFFSSYSFFTFVLRASYSFLSIY